MKLILILLVLSTSGCLVSTLNPKQRVTPEGCTYDQEHPYLCKGR